MLHLDAGFVRPGAVFRGPLIPESARSNACDVRHDSAGQADSHHGTSGRRYFNLKLAGMVLNDFLCDGQAQPGSVFLAITDEWLKDAVADGGIEPRSVIDDPNFDLPANTLYRHRHVARFRRDRLTRVEQ